MAAMIEDELVEAAPGMQGPVCIISRMSNGAFRYLWWDSADSYVVGEPPTRRKYANVLQGVLPMLLADGARTGNISDDNTYDLQP